MTHQASHLSPADQRTATEQALIRIRELEEQLNKERARNAALEDECDQLRAAGVRMANDVAQLEYDRDSLEVYVSDVEAHRRAAEAALSDLRASYARRGWWAWVRRLVKRFL